MPRAFGVPGRVWLSFLASSCCCLPPAGRLFHLQSSQRKVCQLRKFFSLLQAGVITPVMTPSHYPACTWLVNEEDAPPAEQQPLPASASDAAVRVAAAVQGVAARLPALPSVTARRCPAALLGAACRRHGAAPLGWAGCGAGGLAADRAGGHELRACGMSAPPAAHSRSRVAGCSAVSRCPSCGMAHVLGFAGRLTGDPLPGMRTALVSLSPHWRNRLVKPRPLRQSCWAASLLALLQRRQRMLGCPRRRTAPGPLPPAPPVPVAAKQPASQQ